MKNLLQLSFNRINLYASRNRTLERQNKFRDLLEIKIIKAAMYKARGIFTSPETMRM